MSKQFDVQDVYYKKAKEDGYRARSAYKLEGIQKKFKIMKPGDRVLDLGSAPGSFLQYINNVVGYKGMVVGIDLQKIEPFPKGDIFTYVGDIFDNPIYEVIKKDFNTDHFDVITSDLAPKTSGVKFIDGGKSLDLSLQVLEVAKKHLNKGGNCVIKILPGFNESDLTQIARVMFKQVKKFIPKAVRKSSGESYIVCIGKKASN